jgi:uncharacterized protein
MITQQPPYYQILTQSEFRRMPWKNGLGITLEIWIDQDQQGQRFRISQAKVADNGKFSDFSGLQRTLVLLNGNGVTLTHHNDQHSVEINTLNQPLDIAHFSGGDITEANLHNGAIDDLNIMTRQTDTTARVNAHFAADQFTFTISGHTLFSGFYANSDTRVSLRCPEHSSQCIELPSQSLLVVTQASLITIEQGQGVSIVIEALSATL